MFDLTFASRAPSNIAWVKYMGKREGVGNLPANGSLSMTLDSLCTVAEVVRSPEKVGPENIGPEKFELDVWESETPRAVREFGIAGAIVPNLDESGRERLIRHVRRVKEALPGILSAHGLGADPEALRAGWRLRSANTFPAASGIASSASSFAAFTLSCARAGAADLRLFDEKWRQSSSLRRVLARLSRQGSGSSCRSMEGPFVGWALGESQEEVETLESRLPEMAHFVLVVSENKKAVSSSEAHARVTSSPLWRGRADRAQARAIQMRGAIQAGDLRAVSRIAWEECWEMHSLFHTAQPPFTYWEPGSISVLKALSPMLAESNPSAVTPIVTPIVTMDAGPNIHVSVPVSDAKSWEIHLAEMSSRQELPIERVLRDRQGRGAMPL